MKKVCLGLFLAVMLLSCVNTRTVFIENNLPIEDFVSSFVRQNPNYALNDITKEEANKLFAKVVTDSLKATNLLDGVPMQLEGMNKNGARTMIHLRTWIEPRYWEYKGVVSEVNVDIIAAVDDSLITVLENDKYYRIYGKCIERLNLYSAQGLYGDGTWIYNPTISIEQDDVWDDKVEVDLGVWHYKIDSIALFNGRDKTKFVY